VSKSTIREALKSLEVQGLIKVTTGPNGGGMVVEVPLDRTLQLLQNYLFFKDVTIDDIYTVRQVARTGACCRCGAASDRAGFCRARRKHCMLR
jgi:DNA-binding FadR family transcriptional regulator